MILRISDTSILDGEWQCDLTYFTNRELHEIKKATGLRAGEFAEALEAGDNDLMVAMAEMVLKREGVEGAGRVWDLPVGKLTLELDTEEEEAEEEVPPTEEPEGEEESDSNDAPSGSSSNGAGDISPESVPSLTGIPG